LLVVTFAIDDGMSWMSCADYEILATSHVVHSTNCGDDATGHHRFKEADPSAALHSVVQQPSCSGSHFQRFSVADTLTTLSLPTSSSLEGLEQHGERVGPALLPEGL
jgi:hypothetical protein